MGKFMRKNQIKKGKKNAELRLEKEKSRESLRSERKQQRYLKQQHVGPLKLASLGLPKKEISSTVVKEGPNKKKRGYKEIDDRGIDGGGSKKAKVREVSGKNAALACLQDSVKSIGPDGVNPERSPRLKISYTSSSRSGCFPKKVKLSKKLRTVDKQAKSAKVLELDPRATTKQGGAIVEGNVQNLQISGDLVRDTTVDWKEKVKGLSEKLSVNLARLQKSISSTSRSGDQMTQPTGIIDTEVEAQSGRAFSERGASSSTSESEEDEGRLAALRSVAVDSNSIMQNAAEAGRKKKARRGRKKLSSREKREERERELDDDSHPELKLYQVKAQDLLLQHLDNTFGTRMQEEEGKERNGYTENAPIRDSQDLEGAALNDSGEGLEEGLAISLFSKISKQTPPTNPANIGICARIGKGGGIVDQYSDKPAAKSIKAKKRPKVDYGKLGKKLKKQKYKNHSG